VIIIKSLIFNSPHYNNFIECTIIHKQKFKAYLKLINKHQDYNIISRKLKCGNKYNYLKEFQIKENENNNNNNNNSVYNKNVLNFLQKDINNYILNNRFKNHMFNKLKIESEYYPFVITRNITELKNMEKSIKNKILKYEKRENKNKNKIEDDIIEIESLLNNYRLKDLEKIKTELEKNELKSQEIIEKRKIHQMKIRYRYKKENIENIKK